MERSSQVLLKENFFQIFGQKRKNFQSSEVWILIKLQCVIYQWIRFNELYKLLNFFFQFQITVVLEILTKKQKNSKE